MCGKRERNQLVAGLRCHCEGAWLYPWETECLCQQAQKAGRDKPAGNSEAWQAGQAVPSTPRTVLGTLHHPLPNVHSDRSRLGVQHCCLIKWCMLISCSMHPTTPSGGLVCQNGGKGDFII